MVLLVAWLTRTPYCATYTQEWWWEAGWLLKTQLNMSSLIWIFKPVWTSYLHNGEPSGKASNCSGRDRSWVNHFTKWRVTQQLFHSDRMKMQILYYTVHIFSEPFFIDASYWPIKGMTFALYFLLQLSLWYVFIILISLFSYKLCIFT